MVSFHTFDWAYVSMVGSKGGHKLMTLLFTLGLNMLTTPQNGSRNDPKWSGGKKSLRNFFL